MNLTASIFTSVQVLNEITVPFHKEVPLDSSCEFGGYGLTLGDALEKKFSHTLGDNMCRAFPSKDCSAKLTFSLVVRDNGHLAAPMSRLLTRITPSLTSEATSSPGRSRSRWQQGERVSPSSRPRVVLHT